MVLAFCTMSNQVNTCIKFHEDILKQFLSYRADIIKSQNLLFSVSKAITLKIGNPELQILHFSCLLMLVNIPMKFHEDILNVFKL